MSEQAIPRPRLQQPTPRDGKQAVLEARRVFQKTLSCWACDLLWLRQTGFTRPACPTPPPLSRAA